MALAKSSTALVVGVVASSLLSAGCGGKVSNPLGPRPAVADAGDLASPAPLAVRLVAGRVILSGSAAPGARVRLATPLGEALFADADRRGRWTLDVGGGAEPRIFGLSATAQGRQMQAQGYVLVTPPGQAALLRAGAGARRFDPARGAGLRAIDFDGGGGVEVSALTPPGATVILRLDGRQVAQGRADAAGHYDASLPSPGASAPIRRGPHQIQVYGDGFADTVTFQVSTAAPLAQGPLRSQLTSAGLRVDWMTPGGGVQSTLLVH
ncbi:hypothetical protein [Phenylobacterium sp.]|uniref:hypothetical protein n=1 Tax=Phenylobacterium sp. TaxID=1871053 RepID=UPI00286CA4C6|nr:hypothetical protein [Phenylobacterium sp.]